MAVFLILIGIECVQLIFAKHRCYCTCSLINVAVLIRREIVCGVQNVTRCLERDELRLVIVDRSSPWLLHQHLAQLSAVRRCPAVAVDNMANTFCAVLAVTRLCAVGFKVN